MCVSSSSSCRAACADIPDRLSPFSPYHSSPPAGLQDYNPCPHIAAVCKFVLVVPLLHIHEWGSHRSTSLMSSSLLLQQCPACLVRRTCIVFVMGASVRIVGVSWGVVARTCLILLSTFLCNFRPASSPAVRKRPCVCVYIYIYIYIYIHTHTQGVPILLKQCYCFSDLTWWLYYFSFFRLLFEKELPFWWIHPNIVKSSLGMMD